MALFNSRKRSSSLDPSQARAKAREDERPLQAVPAPPTAGAPVVTPVTAPVASGLRVVGAPAAPAQPAAGEQADGGSREEPGDPAGNDMRNLPLGTLLFRHGLVSQAELEEALTTGMATGERLGEILISRGRVSEDDIARLLAVQQGLPFLHEDEVPFELEATRLLPLDEARSMMALPVAYENGAVVVATPNPSARQPEHLHQLLHRNVRAVVVTDSVFSLLLERAEQGDAGAEEPAGEAGPVDTSFLHGDGAELRAEATSVAEAAVEEYAVEAPEPAAEPQDEAAEELEAESHEQAAAEAPVWDPWRRAEDEVVELDAVETEQEAAVADPGEPEDEASVDEWHEQPETFAAETLAPAEESGHAAPGWAEEPEPSAEAPEPAAAPAWADEREEPQAEAEPTSGEVEVFSGEAEPMPGEAELLAGEDEAVRVAEEAEPESESGNSWYEPVEHAEQEQAWQEPVEHAEPEQPELEAGDGVEPPEAVAGDGAGDAAEPALVGDGRLDELGAQHEASVGRIESLLGQIEVGATGFSDLRRRLDELSESLRVTEESLAEREQRLAELTQTHDDDQRRIEELLAQLRERDHSLGELGGRVEELTGRLVSAEERLDEREQRLARIDASLSESASRVEALFRQVELRDEALSGFADKLEALARHFADQQD